MGKPLDDMLLEVPKTMDVSNYAFIMSYKTKEYYNIVDDYYKGVHIVSVNNRLCEFDKIYLTPDPTIEGDVNYNKLWEELN